MPRAFLLTNNRFQVLMRPFSRESSPEHSVQTAEEKLHRRRMAKIITEDQSTESSASTDQFYNLTKLAEVSLAEAAGKIFQRNSESKQNDGNIIRNEDNDVEYSYSHKIFDKMARKKKVKLEISGDAHDKLDYDIKLPETPQDTSAASLASSEDSHECPDCGKKYSTSSNLARHRQTHRSLGDKKARRCPHCDKVYVSMPAFSMHVRTHNQGCKCHYCGKCFSRPWLLQGHIRTHTGEKPFKCQVCSKAFADKSNLRAHVQTHSNTKPHVCGRCGKAFALKSYLYKHEESSCMRIHGKNISRESSPDFSNQSSQPSDMSTRMSEGFSVIQSPERPTTSPDYPCATLNLSNEYSIAMNHDIRTNSNYSNYENCYRTSVISTNRDAYSTFSPIIYNNKYNEENVQDQPVDFSPKTGKQIVYSTIGEKLQLYKTNERSTAFQIGMAIAV